MIQYDRVEHLVGGDAASERSVVRLSSVGCQRLALAAIALAAPRRPARVPERVSERVMSASKGNIGDVGLQKEGEGGSKGGEGPAEEKERKRARGVSGPKSLRSYVGTWTAPRGFLLG